MYADRYSGWAEVERVIGTSFHHIREVFLRWFMTYGVPEEIAYDGGPPFNSSEFVTFREIWNIRKRLSSAYYPQSNGRAELAVKSMKRALTGNINPVSGKLNTDAAARAIMTYRNTPNETGMSPAQILFGRPLRDHLPQKNRTLHKGWQLINDDREVALRKRHMRPGGLPAKRTLKPLQIGDSVQVQNQTGNAPKKWHSTGEIVEVLPHRQYLLMMDGSRRVSLRNRRFLRKIDPVCRKISDPPLTDTVPQTPSDPLNPPRLSERPRQERKLFVAKLHGQSHA